MLAEKYVVSHCLESGWARVQQSPGGPVGDESEREALQ